MQGEQLNGIVDSVIQIGRTRAEKLERAKDALLKGDESQAITIMRELFGIATRPEFRVMLYSVFTLALDYWNIVDLGIV